MKRKEDPFALEIGFEGAYPPFLFFFERSCPGLIKNLQKNAGVLIHSRLGIRSFPRRVSGIGEGAYVLELADFKQRRICSKKEKCTFLCP